MTDEHQNKGGSYLIEQEGAPRQLVHRTKTAEEAAREDAVRKPAASKPTAPAPKSDKGAGAAGQED